MKRTCGKPTDCAGARLQLGWRRPEGRKPDVHDEARFVALLGGAAGRPIAARAQEDSLLGFPAQDGRHTSDGVGEHQAFGDGHIFWHPATGGFEVHGAILEKYNNLLCGPAGPLGYPTSNEQATPSDATGQHLP
jgi:hypothetical protein